MTGTCFISKANHQKSIDKLNDEITGYKTSITEKDVELDKIKKNVKAILLEKTIENRCDCDNFVFYDGPATANGMPGIHHML